MVLPTNFMPRFCSGNGIGQGTCGFSGFVKDPALCELAQIVIKAAEFGGNGKEDRRIPDACLDLAPVSHNALVRSQSTALFRCIGGDFFCLEIIERLSEIFPFV